MTTHNLYFLGTIGIFVGALLLIAGYYYAQSRRPSPASWEDLFARLTWVNRNDIAEVALDLIDESGQTKTSGDAGSMDPAKLWSLIGGLSGLEVLERNSEVLIELAFYVQKWYPEALAIAEQLRLDARELKWHVDRLKGAARKGNLEVSFPFYAQRAVVSYYRMTRLLLILYEAGSFPMLANLQRAL